jgi:phospho-N-acetylmuramoyl-pentapeptide-transferase
MMTSVFASTFAPAVQINATSSTSLLAYAQGGLSHFLHWTIIAAVVAFLLAPFLTFILYKYKIIKGQKVELARVHNGNGRTDAARKAGTPTMGGLLVIVTVAILTIGWNWDRQYTWVPIGVMLFSALLGGVDDLMNIFGHERRSRKVGHVIALIRVHKDWKMRLWYIVTLPWTAFKRLAVWFGSRPGKGIQVHEKLILQFIAGAVAAWWVYWKLGVEWHYIMIPFIGIVHFGWLIIPLFIFIVMFTANAVNIADGMDGLAGGMLIITFGALTLLSWILGFAELAVVNAVTMGALIAYTYFNIKPARFHMGDVGSLGIGALMAMNALAIGSLGSLFFLGFMFYIEAITVVIQVCGRYLLGRRIFRMAPLHHHFELKGWSEEKTIMRFWIIHLAFVIFGVWVALH